MLEALDMAARTILFRTILKKLFQFSEIAEAVKCQETVLLWKLIQLDYVRAFQQSGTALDRFFSAMGNNGHSFRGENINTQFGKINFCRIAGDQPALFQLAADLAHSLLGNLKMFSDIRIRNPPIA